MTDLSIPTLDLRGIPCPSNSSRALIELSLLDSGSEILLLIDDGRAIEHVQDSLEEEGHSVSRKQKLETYWQLQMKRGDF